MKRLPPIYRGHVAQWANEVEEYLRDQVGAKAQLDPQAVLLLHQTTTTRKSAAVEGVLMYDAVLRQPVFSANGQWLTLATGDNITLYYTVTDDAGNGTIEGDANATDYTGQSGANGACAEVAVGQVAYFTHKGQVWVYTGSRPVGIGAGCPDVAVNADFTPFGGLVDWDDILNKPSEFPPEPHTHTEGDIIDLDKYTQAEINAQQAAQDQNLVDHEGDTANPHATSYINLSDTVDADYVAKADFIPAVTLTEDGTRLVAQGIRLHSDQATYAFDDGVWYQGTAYHCILAHSAQPFSLTNFRPVASQVGTAVQFSYDWTNTIAGQVPDGYYGMDNVDPTLATLIRVSVNTNQGFAVGNFWDALDTGDVLTFQEDAGGSASVTHTVSGPGILVAGVPDYYEVPVTYLGDDGVPAVNVDGTVSILQNPNNKLPSGGEADQHLTKVTGADFDTDWTWPAQLLGDWVQQEYKPNSIVLDGEYLMYALTTTVDRPAPQLQGSALFAYNGASPTSTITAKTLAVGNDYTFPETMALSRYRIYTVTGNDYSAYYQLDGGAINELITFTATSTGWQTFPTNEVLVGAGSVLSVVAYVTEPDPAPVTFTLSYNYQTPNNAVTPTAGNISHADKERTSLRVHKTDQNGDQSVQLATIVVGDTIEGGGIRWAIQAIVDNGTWIDYSVAPASQGAPDGVQDFIFETVTSTPITTVVDVDYFLGEVTVQPFFAIDGGARTDTDSGYGIDIELQQISISPDWGLMAISGSSPPSAGGGDGVPEAPSDGITRGRKDELWEPVLPLAGGEVTGNIVMQHNGSVGRMLFYHDTAPAASKTWGMWTDSDGDLIFARTTDDGASWVKTVMSILSGGIVQFNEVVAANDVNVEIRNDGTKGVRWMDEAATLEHGKIWYDTSNQRMVIRAEQLDSLGARNFFFNHNNATLTSASVLRKQDGDALYASIALQSQVDAQSVTNIFTSPEAAIVNDTTTVYAHGLSGQPDTSTVRLTCTVAHRGYQVGDTITGDFNFTIVLRTTDIVCVKGHTMVKIMNLTNGNLQNVIQANWTWSVVVFRTD